ncbi:MAG TPA: RNA-binding S4 domain-containing protein [Methylomirabilota bacterium]|jgi:ribosome-associated heat shock protein Hsp15|nr:RNA-binding S4 domain-containing protein [Methylomirabilota bacterium]
MTGGQETIRLDKWLWHARFAKSRAVAAELCQSRRLRIGGEVISKPHRLVRVGDVLTFPAGGHIRTVRVAALGARRGPAAQARTLYQDLAPPGPESALPRRHAGWK